MLWEAILSELQADPGLNELHDLTGVTKTDISTSLVWELSQSEAMRVLDADERSRGTKVAIAAKLDVLYGLALMNQTLRSESPAEFRAFRSVSEAREWLGLPAIRDDSNSN
jgi:hypothetical protein